MMTGPPSFGLERKEAVSAPPTARARRWLLRARVPSTQAPLLGVAAGRGRLRVSQVAPAGGPSCRASAQRPASVGRGQPVPGGAGPQDSFSARTRVSPIAGFWPPGKPRLCCPGSRRGPPRSDAEEPGRLRGRDLRRRGSPAPGHHGRALGGVWVPRNSSSEAASGRRTDPTTDPTTDRTPLRAGATSPATGGVFWGPRGGASAQVGGARPHGQLGPWTATRAEGR